MESKTAKGGLAEPAWGWDADIAERAVAVALSIAELPDRNSPDDQPEMMLVTRYEIIGLVSDAMHELISAQPAALLRPSEACLMHALTESVLLQSHYAALLNQYDGGNRKGFCDAKEWLDRLQAIKD